MNLNKLIQFFSYWKEVILISIFCMTFFIIVGIYFPDYENPFYSYRLRTGAQVMVERWPHPDTNDPNFLADFRKYMGFDFHNPNDLSIPIADFSDLNQARKRLKARMTSDDPNDWFLQKKPEPNEANHTILKNLIWWPLRRKK